MGLKFYDNGHIRDADDLELAERIVQLKERKDPWVVIDELIQVWAEREKDEANALKVEIKDHKENLADKEFGQTNGGRDFERRFTLVFPQNLQLLIRTQYKSDELPFDSDFFKEFARRYPYFKVADKV